MEIDWNNLPFNRYDSWNSLKYSLDRLEKAYAYGSITEREYHWRVLFWVWSAARFEGYAANLQDRCYNAFGLEGVNKRVERVTKLKERYIKHHFRGWIT